MSDAAKYKKPEFCALKIDDRLVFRSKKSMREVEYRRAMCVRYKVERIARNLEHYLRCPRVLPYLAIEQLVRDCHRLYTRYGTAGSEETLRVADDLKRYRLKRNAKEFRAIARAFLSGYALGFVELDSVLFWYEDKNERTQQRKNRTQATRRADILVSRRKVWGEFFKTCNGKIELADELAAQKLKLTTRQIQRDRKD